MEASMRTFRCASRTLRSWKAGLLAGGALLASLQGAAVEPDASLSGTYRDERVLVELNAPTRTGEHTTYTGIIQLGDAKFPLKAEADEARLTGTFESGGDRFEFSGTVVGHMLVLTTDGTTYRLKKQVMNPLARPEHPNPLAKPRANPLLATNRVGSPAELTNATPALPPRIPNGTALRLQRHSILDDLIIGGEAFSCLVPSGWQLEGGLSWRLHPLVPAYLALRLHNTLQIDSVELFPTIPFVWSDEGIPLYPAGSSYLGNEVAEPIIDPVVYVQKIILPHFRKEAPPAKVLLSEELPAVADAVAQSAQEPGIEKKFRAARVRLEYQELGRWMHEDVYCVLVAAYVPAVKLTFWGADRNYSFKAEKGKLEADSKIMQTIIDSFQTSLPWFNRYVQLVQLLAQSPFETLRSAADLSARVARTAPEINEARREAFDRQRTSQTQINRRFSLYVHGTDPYENPVDGRAVELPADYGVAWMNASGEYLLLNDPNYNPNISPNDSWQRLAKARP
jgi:hypothetical protein